MTQVFKIARYQNWGFPTAGPKYGQVLYTIIEGKCIFTGITDNVTSTINTCETIVEEIAKLEGRGIHDLEFYDLQTHVTYTSKIPGKFELDRIVIHSVEDSEEGVDEDCIIIGNTRNWSPGWDPANLPTSIIEIFRPCIGHLKQRRTHDEAREEIARAYNFVLTIPEFN